MPGHHWTEKYTTTTSVNPIIPTYSSTPHSEIILQGSYGPGRVFEADTILVKCPSKYVSFQDELQQES